jgi:hypothetical protein
MIVLENIFLVSVGDSHPKIYFVLAFLVLSRFITSSDELFRGFPMKVGGKYD